jgi:hypothetical protein
MTGRFAQILCIPAALAAALLQPPFAMAAATVTAKPAVEELDEVVVKGDHLWQIRNAIREAEDRFYARYNALNANKDFDVTCERRAPYLGTRIATESGRCGIAFYVKARENYSSAFLSGYIAPDPEVVYLERIQDYRKNALKVINSDVQLRKLIHKREELGRLYSRRQKEIFKDRWFDW